MEFCKKCGNLMIAEKSGGKLKYRCRKCGFISRGKRVFSTSISEKLKTEDEKIPVLTEKDTLEQYPKTKIICPECENNEAFWFMQQTRSGDEPPTRFYCCTKCGHKWREY
jgi:DNA-directed RNA polymerase subunit M